MVKLVDLVGYVSLVGDCSKTLNHILLLQATGKGDRRQYGLVEEFEKWNELIILIFWIIKIKNTTFI